METKDSMASVPTTTSLEASSQLSSMSSNDNGHANQGEKKTKKKKKKSSNASVNKPVTELELESQIKTLMKQVAALEDHMKQLSASEIEAKDITALEPNEDKFEDDNDSETEIVDVFTESSHKWFVYGRKSEPNYAKLDSLIGGIIITFQLGVYAFLISQAVQDFKDDMVPVMMPFLRCNQLSNKDTHTLDLAFGLYSESDVHMSTFPNFTDLAYATDTDFNDYRNVTMLNDSSLYCDAELSSDFGIGMTAVILLISMFLTLDFQDGVLAICRTNGCRRLYACYAFLEVVATWATCVITAAQRVWVADTVAALEMSVGLLFVHDLGNRVFLSFKSRENGKRKYRLFFATFILLVILSAILGTTILNVS